MKIALAKDLSGPKSDAASKIDGAAAAASARHVTPGMDGIYAEKEKEAIAVRDGRGNPVFLAQEAAALGTTVDVLALTVLARADTCRTERARIEAARQAARTAIRMAMTPADIAAALADGLAAING